MLTTSAGYHRNKSNKVHTESLPLSVVYETAKKAEWHV